MTQKFRTVELEDYIDDGILDLQDRDDTVLTLFSGRNAPANPFSGMVWNDLSNNELKTWNGSSWETFIDYNENYVKTTSLALNYQPLSSVLSGYSSVTVSPLGFINTAFVPMSYFFRDNLLTDFAGSIGLGSLAYKSKILTSDIADSTISNNKLNPSIIDQPVFKVGDFIPSFNSGAKNGCIKLSTNSSTIYTVGSSASSSTYKGDIYKNVYQFVWENLNLPIYTSTGVVSSKGSSWLSDWNNNKRIELPHIDLPEINIPQDISVSLGTEVSYTVSKSAYYEVTLVGAGGGGAASGAGTWGHQASCSGASGAGFKATMLLNEGDVLTYTIGSGGAKGKEVGDGHSTASAGGSSVLKVKRVGGTEKSLVECAGGGGGEAWWRYSWQIPTGGSVTVYDNDEFEEIISEVTGADGVGGNDANLRSVEGPFNTAYGKGGSAQAWGDYRATTENGGPGMFALEFLAPKEYGTYDPTIKNTLDTLYSGLIYFMKY